VSKYALQNIEILIWNVVGNNIRQEGRPNAKEMKLIKKEACKCIESAILEINDFNKIKMFYQK
jgi:hypothetical protein